MENTENMPDNTQECPNQGKMPESGQKQAVDNKHPPVEYQFKPGQSGNPNGHPKDVSNTVAKAKRSLVKDLIKELEKKLAPVAKKQLADFYPDEDLEEMDQGTGLMKKLVLIGAAGDASTILRIMEFVDGKAKESIDHTNNGKGFDVKNSDEVILSLLDIIKETHE